MRKIITIPAALSVAALALTGCGSSDTDTATDAAPMTESTPTTEPTPETYEAGEYTLTEPVVNTDVTINFPAEGTPEVTAMQNTLSALNAPVEDMTFLTADVDNRQGTETADPWDITMTDKDGNLYTFLKDEDVYDTYDVIMEWPDDVEDPFYTLYDGTVIPEDQYDDLSSMATDAYNDSLDGVKAGQRKTVVFAYDGASGPLPSEFTRITMNDYNGSVVVGEEVTPMSPAPSPGDIVGSAELDMTANGNDY